MVADGDEDDGGALGTKGRAAQQTELPVPADYIESERRTVLFTSSANTAIERVFVLIMVSPVIVLFDAG